MTISNRGRQEGRGDAFAPLGCYTQGSSDHLEISVVAGDGAVKRHRETGQAEACYVQVSLFKLQLAQLVVYPMPSPLCRMNYHLVQRGNELGPNDRLLISPYPTFPGSLEVKE